MIIENDDAFDAGIIDFIFKKITPLLNQINYDNYYHSENFIVSGNLLSRVNLYSLLNDTPENLQTWKSLISKHLPDETMSNKCSVKMRSLNEFNDSNYFPVEVSPECLSLIFKESPVFSKTNVNNFTENEEILIILQHFESKVDELKYLKIRNDMAYCEYLVNLLIKNRQKITEIFKLPEDMFLNKVLESATLKIVISTIDPSKLLDLFSESDLKKIYKKSSLIENIKNNPKMLNNLLPLATADKWISSYKNQKSDFDILRFFDNKFFLATGKSIIKKKDNIEQRGTRKEKDFGNYSVKSQLIEEFKYLSSSIKNQKIENNTVIQWYRSIIRTDFMDLFKLSSSVISIPSKNSPNIDLQEYDNLQKDLKKYHWDSNLKKLIFYYDVYAEGKAKKLAEKIDQELTYKPKTSKIKI